MKRPWGVHTIGNVVGSVDCAAGLPDGRWVRAVPEPYSGNRIVAAWWVLTGRAYALIWPTSEQLANALNPFSKPR
jgi:hypothetical protein